MNRLRNLFIIGFYNILGLCILQFSNNCLELYIDGHSETQLVPIFLLQVSFQELHNIMARPPEYCGLKEARDVENNIIVSDSTLQ